MVLNLTVFYICDSHPSIYIFLEHVIESAETDSQKKQDDHTLGKG